jgi:hypothetical protein
MGAKEYFLIAWRKINFYGKQAKKEIKGTISSSEAWPERL